MSIRLEIEDKFDGKAFRRPLFYTYEGGLRFELSEGGTYLNQFLAAHRKATEICSEIFSDSEDVTVCVKFYGEKLLVSNISVLRSLREIGLFPRLGKEHWSEFDGEWVGDEDYASSIWHYIAFKVSPEYLVNALWCAFAADFGSIEPSPNANIYLFNTEKNVMILPYDDRGMDVVGANKSLLQNLYNQFGNYLLDYDREAMDAVFKKVP